MIDCMFQICLYKKNITSENGIRYYGTPYSVFDHMRHVMRKLVFGFVLPSKVQMSRNSLTG